MAEFTHASIGYWSLPLVILALEKTSYAFWFLPQFHFSLRTQVSLAWTAEGAALGLSLCWAHLADFLSRISGTEGWHAARQPCSPSVVLLRLVICHHTGHNSDRTHNQIYSVFQFIFLLLKLDCWSDMFLIVFKELIFSSYRWRFLRIHSTHMFKPKTEQISAWWWCWAGNLTINHGANDNW